MRHLQSSNWPRQQTSAWKLFATTTVRLAADAGTYGAIRQYSGESLRRLHFIRRAQVLSFTLDEVRTLLQLNDGGSCDTVRTLAEHKLRVVEERLRDLRILRTELRKLTSQCRANRDEASCPLVEALCDAN